MRKLLVAAALMSIAGAAQAQPLNFDQAAYITCKEAHAMNPEAREALAGTWPSTRRAIAVMVPDGAMGAQLAHLVRGGCTLAPDAYLFTVIDRAILAEQKNLPKRQ